MKTTTPLILLCAALIGCQAFPTLTHPRTGHDVAAEFWNWPPYYLPPQPAYHRIYPQELGIQRNDFLLAAEGGF